MFLFWILIVILIALVVRWFWSGRKKSGGFPQAVDSPLDVLKKRYARGEINREEYLEKKKDLE